MRDGTQINTAFSFVAAEHQMLAFGKNNKYFNNRCAKLLANPNLCFTMAHLLRPCCHIMAI
jgi:hypothetical protein